jgi:hypothetical protein
MNLLYTNEARELIAKKVPWVKSKRFNYLTFRRLVDEKVLPAIRYINRGQNVFDEEVVLSLIKKFPTVKPPNRIGIVNWLKGERPKTEKGRK